MLEVAQNRANRVTRGCEGCMEGLGSFRVSASEDIQGSDSHLPQCRNTLPA